VGSIRRAARTAGDTGRAGRARVVAVTAVAAALLTVPATARATQHEPGPNPRAAARAAPAADVPVEQEPSQAELDAQQEQVEALQEQAQAQAQEVQDAQQASRAAALVAGHALERYTRALRDLRAAQTEEERLDTLLDEANLAARRARTRVGQWARHAYQDGTGLNASPALNALLGTNGSDQDASAMATTMHTLQRLGENRSADLAADRLAAQTAAAAARSAAQATAAATLAATAADAARDAADEAVTRQQQILDQAQDDLDEVNEQIEDAQRRQEELQQAAAIARQQATVPGDGSNTVSGRTGACTGAADLAGYPNGRIPLAALCPLGTAPGHYLRADAAYAFDQLSIAYAGVFGAAICVTDSYRTYQTQVRLYATKPDLAAVPGTSNHGWGTAVDLCGGIQDFGTRQHEWLFVNAPLYGWFHPAWAQRTGSRPEAWHWEFGG